jgi:hypothetical protein
MSAGSHFATALWWVGVTWWGAEGGRRLAAAAAGDGSDGSDAGGSGGNSSGGTYRRTVVIKLNAIRFFSSHCGLGDAHGTPVIKINAYA